MVVEHQSAKARVLAIDDDPLVGEVIHHALSSTYAFTLVDRGAAAINILERGDDFEAILLDLAMPGVSGINVAAWMESNRPELLERTGIVTAGAVTAQTEQFLTLTPCRVLLKPFTAQQLTGFVGELMGS